MNLIDLHMHSTHSDGKLTPQELVDWAIKKNISTIAITDHDIISGYEVAKEYANDKDIEIISGIEIGADDEELELYDVHIVGLFVNSKNKELKNLITKYLKAREIQKKEIIKKLNKLNYEISFEELQIEANGPNYGRPHIARILLKKYPEKFANMQEIFDELLANPHTVYIKQKKESIQRVIEIIHNAGGIAILAHPGFYKKKDKIIKKFIESKGDGIEVNYAYENNMDKEKAKQIILEIKSIAKDNNLIVSGGTDFHDKQAHKEIGEFGILKEEFELMRNYLNNNHN